jgi:hypothetical protein
MRILLSEGSGLTSRQVATRLGDLGHHVEILLSSRICLTRFTRHVRKLHLVPRFGREPLAWLDAANAIAVTRAIDVLFPTQEQVAVLSARHRALNVPTVVPPFESLRRVQDKISAFRALQEIGIPQPETVVARSVGDLTGLAKFPVFVKRPISTASSAVRRASSPVELEVVARALGLGASDCSFKLSHGARSRWSRPSPTTGGWWPITPICAFAKAWAVAPHSRKVWCCPRCPRTWRNLWVPCIGTGRCPWMSL